jgi:transforming growth factor-beta-induced protein
MKLRMLALLPISLVLVQPLLTACGSSVNTVEKDFKMGQSGDTMGKQNLVQLLQSDSRFSILVAAVKAAGLVEVLSSNSKFTVFAPSNKAFEALPAGTLDTLLKPENKEKLKSILLYHVAAGSLKASDVLAKDSIATAQGKSVSVDAVNARINSSNIIKTDIIASNGVAHEIDAVLLPPSEETKSADSSGAMMAPKSLTATLAAEPRFSILVAAVTAAGLAETLSGSSNFTVFAPSNKAFEALPAGTVESLLKPENKEKLKSILLYHVAAGSLKAGDVLAKSSIPTAQGKSIMVDAKNLKINSSGIVKTDILASNGVIHEIGAVLLPPSDVATAMSAPIPCK